MNTKDEPPIREAGVMNADVTSNVTTKDPAEYWAARWRTMATEVNKLDIENRKLRAENQNLGRDMLTNEDLERIFSQVENEPRKLLAGRDIAYVLKAYREQSAEIERLTQAEFDRANQVTYYKDESERLSQAIEQTWRPEVKALHAENERLKEELGHCQIQRDDARYGSQQHQAEVETWRATAIQADALRYEAANLLNVSLAEVDRLKAAVVEIGTAHVAAQTEVERLRQANTMLAEEREAWKAEALNLRQLLRETIEAGEAWKSRAIAIQIEDECDADD